MIIEQNKKIEKYGETSGYLASYFIFTTFLFFIFILLNKMPESWTYFHIMGITIIIALTGYILKRILK